MDRYKEQNVDHIIERYHNKLETNYQKSLEHEDDEEDEDEDEEEFEDEEDEE